MKLIPKHNEQGELNRKLLPKKDKEFSKQTDGNTTDPGDKCNKEKKLGTKIG